jgi:hypothetical protein
MKGLIIACALVVFAGGATATTASGRGAAQTLCVGGTGCYQTLQGAFDAAHDGDTVRIAAGTFAGGATVDKSITIVGAGASRTVLKGGSPVLTFGVAFSPNADKLRVSLSGVTVTGGLVTSAPTPDGPISFVAVGAGIRIPSGPAPTVGATVTIRDSVITGNRATPTTTVDSGDPCPGNTDCPHAEALGAGIMDVGRLTLINSVVSDNVAGGGVTSDARGGGIWTATNSGPGSLTLVDSTVSGNRAAVADPYGRFAEGGGIEVQDGEAFVVRNTRVSDNTASVTSSFPEGVELFANSGGIHIGGSGSAAIAGSRIEGNVAVVDDPADSFGAADAALSEGAFTFFGVGSQTFDLHDTVVRGNRTITNAASSDQGPSGGIFEIDGQASVSGLTLTENTTTVTGHSGSAAALGTFFAFDQASEPIVVSNSVVRGNTVTANAAAGPARIEGAGVLNDGPLQLRNVLVEGNVADARGQGGFAQGGGIWNGQPFGPDGAPTPELTLVNAIVTGNVLRGSAGVALQGGGLFTAGFPVARTNTVIAANVPDQCYGC